MKRNYDYQKQANAMYDDSMVLVLEDKYLSHIEGRMLTLLEGLVETNSDKRHQAIKSLVREAVWGDLHNGWAFPLNAEEFEKLSIEFPEHE